MASGKNVNSGGAMFNTAKPVISAETQDLLKLMMQESKLTNLQQRQLTDNIKKGKPLPTQQTKPNKPSPKKTQSKVMNGRELSLSGKRRKEVIDVINEKQKTDTYRPSPGKSITEKDKELLRNRMAYGKDAPDINKNINQQHSQVSESNIDVEVDEFDEVLQQIEERRDFLSEMEKLGQGKNYRTLIETEISQKIRDLEQIDKKRTKELERRLQEEKS